VVGETVVPGQRSGVIQVLTSFLDALLVSTEVQKKLTVVLAVSISAVPIFYLT